MNRKTQFALVVTLTIFGAGAFFLVRVGQASAPEYFHADVGTASKSLEGGSEVLASPSTESWGKPKLPIATNQRFPQLAQSEPKQSERQGGLSTSAAVAGQPSFSLPIDCDPGVDCWIANYVDVEPEPEVRDYACGRLGYDGHKGTDFAIRDLATMRQGVPVLAAVAGKVVGTRDGMADIDVTRSGAHAVKNVECGNGALIDAGNGWTTQYCHLRQGSVRVKKGDVVAVGDELGLVGLSGLTQFPHIHLQIAYEDKIVDPFVGLGRKSFCGVGPHPLWRPEILDDLTYQPAQVYNIGITNRGPKYAEVANGQHKPQRVSADAPALVLWADIFGVQAGDQLRFLIEDSAGKAVHDNLIDVDKTQARRFQFSGLRRPGAAWPTGSYSGTVTLTRRNDKLGPGSYAAETKLEIR